MKGHLFILLTLAIQPLAAQVQFNSVNDFVRYVNEHNPTLSVEKLNTDVAKERLSGSRALLLPHVKAFGSFDNNISLPVQLVPAEFLDGPEGQFAEIQFGTRYNSAYGVEASLPLLNVSNWKTIKSAQLAASASAYQEKNKVLQMKERAATVYYMTLLSLEALELNQSLVQSTDSLLRAAIDRFKNGLIEQMELNRIKAIHLESENQYLNSSARLSEHMNTIRTLTNIHQTDSVTLTEKIGDLQLTADKSQNVALINTESLPGYTALILRRQQSITELSKQRAKLLPEVSLYGRYVNQSFSNELEVFSNELKWYPIGLIGVRAEWNLFTGLNRKANIREAALKREIADKELNAYLLNTNKENDDLLNNFQTTTESLRNAATHFSLNKDNYRIAGIKYEQGIYSIDQYINIYQELIRSQNQYLNTLANYLVYYSMIQSRNENNQ